MQSKEYTMIPDSIQLDFNSDYLWYQERYDADNNELAETVAQETIALFEDMTDRLSKAGELEVEVETGVSVDGDDVIAEMTLTPGHPNGSKSFGTVGLAHEFMSLLAMTQPDLWDLVVETTEGVAEETKRKEIDEKGR